MTKKLLRKNKYIINKNRIIYDTTTSYKELLQHSSVNALYGFLNGFLIGIMVIDKPIYILITYYTLKQVESKILNRNKYKSKLGKRFIYPIPSTLGFFMGYLISKHV